MIAEHLNEALTDDTCRRRGLLPSIFFAGRFGCMF